MSTRLSSWSREAAHGISIAALLLLLPGAGLAQSPGSSASAAGEADALSRKAEQLLATAQRAKWPEAARLLERAAKLRAPGDPAAIQEQLVAAELFHYTGSLDRAQANLEDGARQALAHGRIYDAADAFLKAAVVAKMRGHEADAVGYARSAEQLARSPHLTRAECDCIRNRIVWLPDRQVAIR